MDVTQATALLVARQQAQIAVAAAAKIMEVNADAARDMVGMIDRSARTLEKVAAQSAHGIGGRLDMTI